MSRALILAVLLTLGFAGVAHAEKKVDWSQYLEPPGSRPTPRATPTVTESKAKPRAKKAAKATKQRSAKAATKAKRKKPARRR